MPFVQTENEIAELFRLLPAVRDVKDGHIRLLRQALQQFDHAFARFLIERAERLIHQQDLRMNCQGPAKRDALRLAAGQSDGAAMQQVRNLKPVSQLIDALLNHFRGEIAKLEAQRRDCRVRYWS